MKVTFAIFCQKVRELVEDLDGELDDEYLNDLYVSYKVQKSYPDVEEWINEWFQDNTPDTHDHYLKSKVA